jgi:hypothetical protein
MASDYTEMGKRCGLDNVISEQAALHRTSTEYAFNNIVTEELKNEICRDCVDRSCWRYKALSSETNVKRKSN